MRTFFNAKNIIVLFWLIPSFLFLWIMTDKAYGTDEMFSLGIYEKKQLPPDMTDAVYGVKIYFEALCEGKIDIISMMMDENLMKRYHHSLNDPSYSSLLIKTYDGSKLTITDIYRNKIGSYVIDADINSPNIGTIEVSFELDKEIRKNHLSNSLHSFGIKNQID